MKLRTLEENNVHGWLVEQTEFGLVELHLW